MVRLVGFEPTVFEYPVKSRVPSAARRTIAFLLKVLWKDCYGLLQASLT